jgi:hypothetical protein
MNRRVDQLVRERAAHRCEYCHFPQSAHPLRFPIDHIVPRKHRGRDDDSNLALSCPFCNWHKGSNLSGVDPVTGQVVGLFSPRRDQWDEHFEWNGHLINGRTPIGRATIVVMNINDTHRVELRRLANQPS